MASKAATDITFSVKELEELIRELTKLIDRCKVMYEQYFMGIQKLPPSQLHRDAERKIRDLTQVHIRNTALRYRFANISSKFGSYNSYWKRTMRQIEQGRYYRDIARVGRKAARTGAEVPEEILAAMPKRMRDRIERDRAAMAARLEREEARGGSRGDDIDADDDDDDDDFAVIRDVRPRAHKIDDDPLLQGDFNLDEVFSSLTRQAEQAVSRDDSQYAIPLPRPERQEPFSLPEPARPRGGAWSRPPPAAGTSGPAPAPLRAAPAGPDHSPVPGMSEEQTRSLHRRYLQARSLVGAKGDVSYDSLLASLQKQAPKIMAEHNAAGVEFNVVLRGDRVVLKAKPKK